MIQDRYFPEYDKNNKKITDFQKIAPKDFRILQLNLRYKDTLSVQELYEILGRYIDQIPSIKDLPIYIHKQGIQGKLITKNESVEIS